MQTKNQPGTNSTQRRRILKAGIAAVGLPYLTNARGQQKFPFRMAHTEALGSPLTDSIEKWCGMLRTASGGRIDAQHFPAGQLGSYTQLIEQSRLGTVQSTTGGPDTEESMAPEVAVTGGAPGFIYKDEAHVDQVLQGPIGKEVSDIVRKKTGIEFVAYAEVGFRHLLSKKPVTNLDQLKGTKIRVPEIKVWVDFWRRLGANPTPLPYAEQYSALSSGVIDALEADFFSIRGFKWHEQAKFIRIDIDPTEIATTPRLDIGIIGDARLAVEQFNAANDGRVRAGMFKDWRSKLSEDHLKRVKAQETTISTDQTPIHRSAIPPLNGGRPRGHASRKYRRRPQPP